MSPRRTALFDRLTADWMRSARSEECAFVLSSWKHRFPALEPYTALTDLKGLMRRPPQEADSVLASFAALAPTERFAAQTLLYLLLPGIRNISNRLEPVVPDRDERQAQVIEAAWERIVTYPIRNRPRYIALNVLLDTEKRVRRRLPRLNAIPSGIALKSPDHEVPPDEPPAGSGEHLAQLLDEAIRTNLIAADDAAVILASRVFGISTDELATARAVNPSVLRRRRQRAEKALVTFRDVA